VLERSDDKAYVTIAWPLLPRSFLWCSFFHLGVLFMAYGMRLLLSPHLCSKRTNLALDSVVTR